MKYPTVLILAIIVVFIPSVLSDGIVNAMNKGISIVTDPWEPATSSRATVNDLHKEYNNIFRRGNRNAASHLWSTFLLERAHQMTPDQLIMFFTGFCVVSGSPIRPSNYNRYKMTLERVGKNKGKKSLTTAYMYYCCWPCVCDTEDFIKIDSRSFTSVDGIERTYDFAVIGNPCDNPEKLHVPFRQPYGFQRETTIADSAPELRCLSDGSLEGATMSDGGYVIIGMVFDAHDAVGKSADIVETNVFHPTPGRISVSSEGVSFQDQSEFSLKCKERADNGYNSGMGEIFRRVCEVSPINELI